MRYVCELFIKAFDVMTTNLVAAREGTEIFRQMPELTTFNPPTQYVTHTSHVSEDDISIASELFKSISTKKIERRFNEENRRHSHLKMIIKPGICLSYPASIMV